MILVSIAKTIYDLSARIGHLPKRTGLLLRHRMIPFLHPYWDGDELMLGRASTHRQSDPEAQTRLERAFLQLLGVDGIAAATSSGRTALELALRSLRAARPTRAEVLLPSYSCRGLLDPIVQTGLRPRFVDIGADLNLNADTLGPHLNEQTLAVLVVHLGGKYAEDLPTVLRMARDVGAVVIEDVCQACGGNTAGRAWGSEAPMSIFSFGLGKNITATAGGMLVAQDFLEPIQSERTRLTHEDPQFPLRRFATVRRLRSTALRLFQPSVRLPEKAFQAAYGYQSISALDAQLVLSQLAKLKTIVERRSSNAALLIDRLQDVSGLDVPGANGPNVWTKFSVAAASEAAASGIRRRLYKSGIETEEMYSPLHLRPCGRDYTANPLPAVEAVYRRVFNVPIHPSLTGPQIQFVADTLWKTLKQANRQRKPR